MCVTPPSSTCTGCVLGVGLECVWIAIGWRGKIANRVRTDLTLLQAPYTLKLSLSLICGWWISETFGTRVHKEQLLQISYLQALPTRLSLGWDVWRARYMNQRTSCLRRSFLEKVFCVVQCFSFPCVLGIIGAGSSVLLCVVQSLADFIFVCTINCWVMY